MSRQFRFRLRERLHISVRASVIPLGDEKSSRLGGIDSLSSLRSLLLQNIFEVGLQRRARSASFFEIEVRRKGAHLGHDILRMLLELFDDLPDFLDGRQFLLVPSESLSEASVFFLQCCESESARIRQSWTTSMTYVAVRSVRDGVHRETSDGG